MLDYMRQHSRSTLIYLFFGIIIAVFVINFGPQSRGCQRSGRVVLAASVNGAEIDSMDLQAEYIRHFGMSTAHDLDAKAIAAQKAKTLQAIVNAALLAQEAERMGLTVTRSELAAFLKDSKRNPDYRSVEVDGKFDPLQYRRLVTGFLQTTLEKYERIRSWELLARKLVEYYASLVRVSETEIQQAYELRETKVNLEFVAVKPDGPVGSGELTDEEVTAYGASHADEISKYYEAHKSDYERPRQVRVRQILVAAPKSGPKDKRDAARKKAQELRDKIAAGADMETLAREESDHVTTKAKGGDLGWLEEGSGTGRKELDEAIFALTKGAVSNVVEAKDGFYLFKLEDEKPAVDKDLAAATPDIARLLLAEDKKKQAAKALAARLLEAAKGAKDLSEALTGLKEGADEVTKAMLDGLKVDETGLFNREGRPADFEAKGFVFGRTWNQIPKIGQSTEIAKAAFRLTADGPVPGDVFELNGTYYVVRLKERKDPAKEVPEEDHARLANELSRRKARRLMGDWERVLFYPGARTMFGGEPELGPWMKTLMERLTRDASIYRNDELFRVPEQQG